MNIYDLLNSTVSVKKRFDFCSDFSDKNRDELGAEEEKKAYGFDSKYMLYGDER